MAKGHAHNAGYKPGDNWVVCDRCGFERRASATQEEWNGLRVCSDSCYEPRHPQDFLRVRADKITPAVQGSPEDTSTSSGVTFAETFTVPSGTFNNEL